MGDVVVKVFPIKPNKYNQVAYFTIIIEDKIKLTGLRLYKRSTKYEMVSPGNGKYFNIAGRMIRDMILNMAIKEYKEKRFKPDEC